MSAWASLALYLTPSFSGLGALGAARRPTPAIDRFGNPPSSGRRSRLTSLGARTNRAGRVVLFLVAQVQRRQWPPACAGPPSLFQLRATCVRLLCLRSVCIVRCDRPCVISAWRRGPIYLGPCWARWHVAVSPLILGIAC